MTLQERLRYIAAHQPKTESSFVSKALLREAADRIDALRKACDIARTMLRTGLPEYDARDVLEILDAAIDAAMERPTGGQGGNIAGDGKNPLPDVAYAGQGWKK